MPSNFVHLHVHSEYSMLDGACRIKSLVQRAVELEMPAVAITDHGVMYGAIEFYKACKAAGIKPIIGCEVYAAPRTRFDREGDADRSLGHLLLLAKDHHGYQNLLKMVSQAHLEGFYYRPRVDTELLAQYHEGLICMTACQAGFVGQQIINENMPRARQQLETLQDIFGVENVYLEIMDHGYEDQKVVTAGKVALSREMGVPLVATNDVHYVLKEDSDWHDSLLCIQTNSFKDDPDRMQFQGEEFYLKSEEEMLAVFPEYPEAITRTVEIAERCNVELELGKLMLPNFPIPQGHTVDSYLREWCSREIPNRYPEPERAVEAEARLDHELKIIAQCNYSGYFLIVGDFIREAKARDIFVGPGRGSAAGSIVTYLLGISEIDPLRFELIFERMLNPERESPPDIDLDFPDDRREEIIEYVREKYGRDRVAQVVTFNTMGAKQAIRDSGRVLRVELSKVDQLAKAMGGYKTIQEALDGDSDFHALYDEDIEVKTLLDTAMKLEGITRHAGVHAAAVVIADAPLTDYVPLKGEKDGTITTQYSMDYVVDVGIVKMDFLGLKTLSIISNTVKAVKRARGISIDMLKIPLDDKKTYDLLCRADTGAVFQLESDGMRALLRDLKPDCFDHIVPLVALYRPGPMEYIPDFVAGRHGNEVSYAHEKLRPVLRDTFGVILYQEQVMRIATDLALFSMPQAEIIMRAMSKKVLSKMEQMKPLFLDGCVSNGVAREIAQSIFDRMESFAKYAFNKSHSAAYALVAYWTAYLKANFPSEMMAAQLTTVIGTSSDVAKYVTECRRSKIRVLPPNINQSFAEFSVKDNAVLFGLAAIRGVGMGSAGEVVAEREENGPYKDLWDFCRRVACRGVAKSNIKTLIEAGAMEELGHRAALLSILDAAYGEGQRCEQDKAIGQVSLFDAAPEVEPEHHELPDIMPFPDEVVLAYEKDLLGLYLSNHPLVKYEEKMHQCVSADLDELSKFSDGTQLVVGGSVREVKPYTTKNGDKMGFVTIESLSSDVEMTVFPRVWDKVGELFEKDALLVLEVKIDRSSRKGGNSNGDQDSNPDEDTVKLLCDGAIPLAKARPINEDKLKLANEGRKKQDEIVSLPPLHMRLPVINIELDVLSMQPDTLEKLHQLLKYYRGAQQTVLHFRDYTDKRSISLGAKFRVAYSGELTNQLAGLAGYMQSWESEPQVTEAVGELQVA